MEEIKTMIMDNLPMFTVAGICLITPIANKILIDNTSIDDRASTITAITICIISLIIGSIINVVTPSYSETKRQKEEQSKYNELTGYVNDGYKIYINGNEVSIDTIHIENYDLDKIYVNDDKNIITIATN